MNANDVTTYQAPGDERTFAVTRRIKPGTKATKQYRAEFADGKVTDWQAKSVLAILDGFRVQADRGDAYSVAEVARREDQYRGWGWI